MADDPFRGERETNAGHSASTGKVNENRRDAIMAVPVNLR